MTVQHIDVDVLFGKLKLCIFLSFIVLCLLQPTANYDLAIIEDYLTGNTKIKISIKKQNGVVVIFGEPWQLLLTGSAVPRIDKKQAYDRPAGQIFMFEIVDAQTQT